MSKVRVESLDYLRGLMAIAVMLYHYGYWSGIVLDSSSLLGRLGIYAVSIFYILSGLSLSIVYKDKINSSSDICNFWIKRICRIAPLFWLVVTIVILHSSLISVMKDVEFKIDFYSIFLNYTFIFGFIKPDGAIPTGGWSIGNEIFFYSILPLVFLLQKKLNRTFLVVLIGSAFSFFYFAYFVFNKDLTLAAQWSFYVHPLNQVLLFFAGVAIGYSNFYSLNKVLGVVCLLIITLSFVFYPVDGNLVGIVSGFERLLFSFLSVAVVFFTFKVNPLLKGWLHRFLIFTGECCYSIYLLHPIASIPVVMVGNVLGLELVYSYSFAVLFTLFISRISYLIIELPSIDFGNRLVKKRVS